MDREIRRVRLCARLAYLDREWEEMTDDIVHITPALLLPLRSCFHCEYFDRVTMDKGGESFCRKRFSARLRTKAGDVCRYWVKA